MRKFASLIALATLLSGHIAAAQQMDRDNPTCPAAPNWALNIPQMRFTPQVVNGHRVLLAEGQIDDNLIPRLQAALRDESIEEIWLRSPGGNAEIGNQAGLLIRQSGLPTRIPQGWTCFSACNFLFMGGIARFVDEGGVFMVHMFTFTSNRQALRSSLDRDAAGTVGQVEQRSALLASADNDFMIRMGVYRTLLTEIMYRQNAVAEGPNRSTRRCLTIDEVRRYNVDNTHTQPSAATQQQPAASESNNRRGRRRN